MKYSSCLALNNLHLNLRIINSMIVNTMLICILLGNCRKKGNGYGVVIVDTEKRYMYTVLRYISQCLNHASLLLDECKLNY